MPVVRELINRISFKINPADKKNAMSAIDSMDARAGKLITSIGTIGKAFATAISGLTVAGAKVFTDYEKDTGATRFFSRNKEEAEELIKLLDKIATKSETISKREAGTAGKIISQTRLTGDQVRQFLPLLDKISQARLDLDLVDVANNFKDIISGGSLDKIVELVPGFKDAAERLSKTTFSKPFGDITDIQRGTILLKAIRESIPRLNDLITENRKTLAFSVEKVSKESSDFFFNFGENTAKPIKEILDTISLTISELNNSESFWLLVRDSAESAAEAFKSIKGIVLELNKKGASKFFKDLFFQRVEESKNTIKGNSEKIIKPLFDLLPDSINPYKEDGPSVPFKPEPMQMLPDFRKNKRTIPDQSKLDISGTIRIENQSGVEIKDMSESITKLITEKMGDIYKTTNARYGGFAT